MQGLDKPTWDSPDLPASLTHHPPPALPLLTISRNISPPSHASITFVLRRRALPGKRRIHYRQGLPDNHMLQVIELNHQTQFTVLGEYWKRKCYIFLSPTHSISISISTQMQVRRPMSTTAGSSFITFSLGERMSFPQGVLYF